MTESTATGSAAALGSIVLALLGVSYYAVLWGLFGAIFGLVLTPVESRWSALFSVLFSALLGAALGDALSSWAGGGQKATIALSAICGAGAKAVVSAAIFALSTRIKGMGGAQ